MDNVHVVPIAYLNFSPFNALRSSVIGRRAFTGMLAHGARYVRQCSLASGSYSLRLTISKLTGYPARSRGADRLMEDQRIEQPTHRTFIHTPLHA